MAILIRLLPYLVIALSVGSGYLWVKQHYETIGYNKAINAIAAQDKEAEDAAKAARDRRHACVDSGWVWSQTTGKCSRG